MRILKRIVVFICIIVVIAAGGWQLFMRKIRLAYVPEEMNVSRIIFAKEEVWGFGPGGNETGLIVYDLPEESAEKIAADGVTYLSSLPSTHLGKPHDWHGRYETWYKTPIIKEDKVWFGIPASGNITTEPKLENYINQYGFSISIPVEIEQNIDKAITTSGNFYAYGRIGVIVIAPSMKKVFYIYAG